MGEEDRGRDYEMREAVAAAEEEEEEMEMDEDGEVGHRVLEWEVGLPGANDLMPLSQVLIPPELASAFSINPEPRSSVGDVNRASQNTISSLRRTLSSPPFSSASLKHSFADDNSLRQPDDAEIEDNSARDAAGESRKTRRMDPATTTEDAESGSGEGGGGDNCVDDNSARTLKRPRLVWTPQLHKRFVDVVTHLGIKKAVPKTIMQLMNVEGLTRENVASHLQKYRLYLKRQGLPYEGPSNSDQLFPSTPTASQSFQGEPGGPMPIPVPYGPPLLPMPVLGMAPPHVPGGQVPMPMNNHPATAAAAAAYHGFQSHPYGMYSEPHKDWPGSNYGSMVSYPQATRGDK